MAGGWGGSGAMPGAPHIASSQARNEGAVDGPQRAFQGAAAMAMLQKTGRAWGTGQPPWQRMADDRDENHVFSETRTGIGRRRGRADRRGTRKSQQSVARDRPRRAA